ncbi:hypothetical protein MalM25_15710 [Planctomycetes bacterium MalM25]|nr:hypothetical protein MalM25_15710 [Planctomycetes bacterium MalM25]
MRPAVDERATQGLKFADCLPINLAIGMLEQRLRGPKAVQSVLSERVRYCVV